MYPSISAAPLEFDEDGVCTGCRVGTTKAVITADEWQRRKALLRDILDRPAAYSNPWTVPTIIGWAATGATAITAGIFGGLASGAASDQESVNNRFGATEGERTEARDKTVTLSTVSDILWITTGVFAGVSAYFTIKMVGHGPEKPADPAKAAAASR